MPPKKQYNAMEDFKRRGIIYLFQQPPAVVLSVLFLGVVVLFAGVMWRRIEKMDEKCEQRVKAENTEWAAALNRNNQSLAHCMAQKDTLFKMYAVVSAEVQVLKAKQWRLEHPKAKKMNVHN